MPGAIVRRPRTTAIRGGGTVKRATIDSLTETHARGGVRRRSFSGERSTLAFTTLDPGHDPHPHSHPHEQIIYLLAGRARVTVGDEVTVLRAGEMLLVPPGVTHWAENLGDEPVLDLSFFSPRRDDYAAEEEGT
jgi:quercetin dioxygenase-like cupin family protein